MWNATGELLEEIVAGLKALLQEAVPADLGLILSPDMPIVDKHSNFTPGYSFLTEPDNDFEILNKCLSVYIIAHPEAHRLYHSLQNNQIVWKEQAVLDYLALHEQVTHKMALSWQLVGGQPA
jgi:hypothetical protein